MYVLMGMLLECGWVNRRFEQGYVYIAETTLQ
jgi:hypothetical protein